MIRAVVGAKGQVRGIAARITLRRIRELRTVFAGEFAGFASQRICRKTHPSVNKSLLYCLPRGLDSGIKRLRTLATTDFLGPKP